MVSWLQYMMRLGYRKEIKFDDKIWSVLKEKLEWYRKNPSQLDSLTNFSKLALAMREFGPQEDLGVDQKTWENMEKDLDYYGPPHRTYYVRLAVNMLLLGYKGKIGLDEEIWEQIERELKYYRKINLGRFADFAKDLFVLTHLLQAPKDQKVEGSIPPLPQVRKF